jgi:hypothetical protein
MKRIALSIIAIGLISSLGCTAVHDSMRVSEKDSRWNPVEVLASKKSKAKADDGEPAPAQTMAAIWNFAVYEKPGSPSIRGLGGRIYFYDAANNAVPADGELVVYGFDGESDNVDSTKPDKKFVFRASEFQSHFSESAIGGSYSVWIPWDKFGGYRKSVTLIPIFRSKDGRILKSGQSINLLAGRIKTETEVDDTGLPYRVLGASAAVLEQSNKKKPKTGVAHASFDETSEASAAPPKRRIRSTEISLTPNLQRQIEAASKKTISTKIEPVAIATVPPIGNAAVNAVAATPAESKSAEPVRTSTANGVFGSPGRFR